LLALLATDDRAATVEVDARITHALIVCEVGWMCVGLLTK
jgi:hypothetical protein